MSSRELHHLRKAAEAAAKIIKKPVIETEQPEPAPQQRVVTQAASNGNQ